jgi:hypothetical protein
MFKSKIFTLFTTAIMLVTVNTIYAENHKDVQALRYEFEDNEKTDLEKFTPKQIQPQTPKSNSPPVQNPILEQIPKTISTPVQNPNKNPNSNPNPIFVPKTNSTPIQNSVPQLIPHCNCQCEMVVFAPVERCTSRAVIVYSAVCQQQQDPYYFRNNIRVNRCVKNTYNSRRPIQIRPKCVNVWGIDTNY